MVESGPLRPGAEKKSKIALKKPNDRAKFSTMSKGENTRHAILEHAVARASRIGLGGLSIGGLAGELEMSKSGLFAHFKSKQTLQIQVLDTAATLFRDEVVAPSFTGPRGEPRIRQLFGNYLDWIRSPDRAGGCPFVQFAVEFDDQPGPVRDRLVEILEGWMEVLAEAVRRAIAEGHFRRDLDPRQLAYEINSLMLGYHHSSRTLRDGQSDRRVETAFENLLEQARPN